MSNDNHLWLSQADGFMPKPSPYGDWEPRMVAMADQRGPMSKELRDGRGRFWLDEHPKRGPHVVRRVYIDEIISEVIK